MKKEEFFGFLKFKFKNDQSGVRVRLNNIMGLWDFRVSSGTLYTIFSNRRKGDSAVNSDTLRNIDYLDETEEFLLRVQFWFQSDSDEFTF